MRNYEVPESNGFRQVSERHIRPIPNNVGLMPNNFDNFQYEYFSGFQGKPLSDICTVYATL